MFSEIKKSKINFLFLITSLIPISLIAGPAIAEINIIIIIIYFLIIKINKKDFSFLNNKVSYLFYILIFIHLINFFIFDMEDLSLYKSVFYFRFSLLFFCIIYLLKLNELLLINYTFNSIMIGLSILIIYGLFQFFEIIISGYSLNRDLILTEYNWKISSLFFDEYILGSFIVRVLPIFYACYFYLKNKTSVKSRNIFLIIIFFSHLMIFLSSERTSIFMMILFDFLFIFFIKNEKQLKSLFIIFYLSIGCLLLIKPSFIESYEGRIWDVFGSNGINMIYKLNQKEPYSFQNAQLNFRDLKFITVVREKHASVALKMFKASPILGHGIKSFPLKCNEKRFFSGYAGTESSCTTHPHNYYLQFLAESGVIIFILFLNIYILILYSIFKILKYDINNNSLLIILIFFSISLFPLMPTGSFFNNWLSIAFFWSSGFLLHFYKKNQ
jgi:O-antigen ligase